MARERRNPPAPAPDAPRVRRRSDAPEIELSDEEVRALADEGVDPDDIARLARERHDPEASDHDRDTARDDLEGLASQAEEEY